MINEDVRRKLEPDIQANESLIWADRPEGVCLDGTSILMALGIFLGTGIYSLFYPVTTNALGVAGLIIVLSLLHCVHPMMEMYGLTNRRLIIKRGHIFLYSASLECREIAAISLGGRLNPNGLRIRQKSKAKSFFEQGSNESVSLWFSEWNWYVLFGLKDREKIKNYIERVRLGEPSHE